MIAPTSAKNQPQQQQPQGAFHSITPAQLQRPSSQATSVKAEPGSNMVSLARLFLYMDIFCLA